MTKWCRAFLVLGLIVGLGQGADAQRVSVTPSRGSGVDGGVTPQVVTGTANITSPVTRIGAGFTTATLTLPPIAGLGASPSPYCFVDGGFVSGSATLTIAANAADTGASGGFVSSGGIVTSVGAYTNAGDGLCFRVSGTHTWTLESGSTIAASGAVSHQFLTGIDLNGVLRAQPAVADLSGFGINVATALGNTANAANGLCTVGTSGATCGLLNGSNTHSGTETFGAVLGAENAQVGTTYTVAATDCGKTIRATNGSAITITIPASIAPAAGTTCIFAVIQGGAGQVSLNGTAVSAATLVSAHSYTKTFNAVGATVGIELTTISATATATLTGDGA